MPTFNELPQEIDVVVVGAGLSGVNQAYRIQSETKRDYVILEARHEMGGTWSLFNYAGVRSDSDHRRRQEHPPIHPRHGPRIRHGQEDPLQLQANQARMGQRDLQMDPDYRRWVRKRSEEDCYHQVRLVHTGYYDYDEALPAQIPGIDKFKGKVVHPQFWPKDFDYKGKKVVVIGSGATAVTLLPSE
ncbi:hypothetical protein U1Q18_051444 [Sarracenia purpurea var. burkii]